MDSRPVNEGRQRPLGGHLPSRPDPPYASPSRQRLAQGAGSWMLCSSQAPLKLRKQAGTRFSTWLGMYWVLQGQNSGARGGGGAKPALTRARGEKRKISRVWGKSVGHLRNTAILLFVSTPQAFQEKKCMQASNSWGWCCETQSINSDLRFRKSPLGRPQGEEQVSPERTRERSKGLSTPTHGAQEAALTNSSDSVVLSQDHRSLRVFSRANFLSATSGAYQTQGPTLTLLQV